MNFRCAPMLTGLLFIGACASHSVSDRISRAQQIAEQHGFSRVELQTSRFDLTAYVRAQKQRGVLRVYIEGDGFAWVTRSQSSINPTPIDPVALKLAVLDTHDSAYLGRPCQYRAILDDRCAARYWTSARFAPEVVEAMNEAVSRLKENAGAEKLVLIGYSGGGAIAALVAAIRSDVIHLVTVAGNLDPAAWAGLHGIPELRGSLNPVNYSRELAAIRQTHFVGAVDQVVPSAVLRSYRNAFPVQANIGITLVPAMDHGCCWDRAWPELLKEIQ